MRRNALTWVRAASVRALMACAQTAVAILVVNIIVKDIHWGIIVAVSLVAGSLSLFTSMIIKMPELATDGSLLIDTSDPEKDIYRLELNNTLDTLSHKQIVKFIVTADTDLSSHK